MDRSTFLKTLGLGAAGLALGGVETAWQPRVSAAAAADYGALSICCFGDSTTWGANGEASGGGNAIAWPAKLQQLLGCKAVYNIGKKGSRLAVSEGRDDSFVERLPQVLAQPADVYMLLGGVNDFQHDVPLGTLGDTEQTTVHGALHIIIEGILSKYPQSRLIVMTPMKNNFQHPTKHYPTSIETNGQGLTQTAYAQAVREAAETYGLPVIDLYASSGISPFVPAQQKLYMPDGLHYSEAGYERLARRIAAGLRAVL